jgi:hypothetical protein
VKITLYDRESGREFLVRQVVDSHGHNPWTGRPLSNEYTAVLAEGLEALEIAGTALQVALDRIIGMAPELMIESDSLLGPLHERLDRLNAGAPATAPAPAPVAAAATDAPAPTAATEPEPEPSA